MIENIPTLYKKHFLLLNMQISINFQSRSVVKNLKKMQTCNKFVSNTT